MPITPIIDVATLQTKLSNSGNNLVVICFTSNSENNLVFESISELHQNKANFLKFVTNESCFKKTGNIQDINIFPTFIFYKNKAEIARVERNDRSTVEAKLIELTSKNTDFDDANGASGYVNLDLLICELECECLNESKNHPFKDCLLDRSGYLESDCDEQLIIRIEFLQLIRLYSIAIKAPVDKGPKNIRIFINQPQTLDFDQADSQKSVQDLTFSEQNLLNGVHIPLKFVNFQNVKNIIIFVKDNQSDEETTIIEKLNFKGFPISTTNMDHFKRITGKRDERH